MGKPKPKPKPTSDSDDSDFVKVPTPKKKPTPKPSPKPKLMPSATVMMTAATSSAASPNRKSVLSLSPKRLQRRSGYLALSAAIAMMTFFHPRRRTRSLSEKKTVATMTYSRAPRRRAKRKQV